MKLIEIFDQLSTGELRTVALGGNRNPSKTIGTEEAQLIIPPLNLAIQELHRRLPMRTDVVTIDEHPAVTMYPLTSKYSQTTGNKDNVYWLHIADSIYFPFKDNVISVMSIYNYEGRDMPINDQDDMDSFFVPAHNVVQHPYPRIGGHFDVVYRATVPLIPKDANPEEYEVDIPYWGLPPVLAYVNHRVGYGMIRGENAQAHQAALIQFEMACQAIEAAGVIHTSVASRDDIKRGGWE